MKISSHTVVQFMGSSILRSGRIHQIQNVKKVYETNIALLDNLNILISPLTREYLEHIPSVITIQDIQMGITQYIEQVKDSFQKGEVHEKEVMEDIQEWQQIIAQFNKQNQPSTTQEAASGSALLMFCEELGFYSEEKNEW